MAEFERELAESNYCAQDLVEGTSVKDVVAGSIGRQIKEVDVAVLE